MSKNEPIGYKNVTYKESIKKNEIEHGFLFHMNVIKNEERMK